jgi:AhpD family alkylhydroperoxidase
MMLDWNAYRKQLLPAIAGIARTSPEIIRGCQGLSQPGAKTGKLDAKTRELIALVTRQCDGFITVHVDAAIRHGAMREEVVDRSAWPSG